MSDRLEPLRALIRAVPDFPKPGILFRDITPLLAAPHAFTTMLDLMAERYAGQGIDAVVGIESRGFIFGAALAARLTVGFVPARKPGKLPGPSDREAYGLEYGTDALEMHTGALAPGARVLIVDDVIATGGTAAAAAALVRRQGGRVHGLAFAIELSALEGRRKLPAEADVYAVLAY